MKNEPKMNTANRHTVLVVIAHTDDEALGLGGTIAKHVENGDIVYGVSMTDGVGARGGERMMKKLKFAHKHQLMREKYSD